MSPDGDHRHERKGQGADDFVQSFRIEADTIIGGRIVRLGSSINEVLIQHDYPPIVSRLVGEAVVLVALIGGGMKFEGRLSLQSRGNGPVSMIVADYLTKGEVRAYASFNSARLEALPRNPSLKALLGEGTLAISLDQGAKKEIYQGIVELDGASLADCAREYLHRSEQVESFLKLSVAQLIDGTGHTAWRAGGLMIQHLPKTGAPFLDEYGEPFQRPIDDPWNRAQIFAQTAEDHELVDPQITAQRLLYRLFHEDGVRVTPPQAIQFGCTCSEARVRRILSRYSEEDYKTMLEDGMVRVRCEFCSRTYRFPPEDLVRPD
jgi:molecular chaperone Hsp33